MPGRSDGEQLPPNPVIPSAFAHPLVSSPRPSLPGEAVKKAGSLDEDGNWALHSETQLEL